MCELCELFVKKIPPLSRWDFLISAQQNLFVALRLLERPKGYWNHLELFGPPSGLLERAQRNWNSRSEALVLFVGRRYYLRPIILWNAAGFWNRAAGSTWNAQRPATYSNPPSSLPLLPEPPVCEPEPESLPEPPAGAEAAEAALLGLRKTVLVPP